MQLRAAPNDLIALTIVLLTTKTSATTMIERVPSKTADQLPRTFIRRGHFTGVSIPSFTPTCTPTIVPDKNGHVPPGTCGSLYDYYPSFGAAVIFCILFGGITMAHVVLSRGQKRGLYLMILSGSIWETFTYILRAISTKHQLIDGLTLPFGILVLLSPTWLISFDFMVLGHMMLTALPFSFLGRIAKYIAPIFVSLNFAVLAVLAVAASMTQGQETGHDLGVGSRVAVYGLIVQLLLVFILIGLVVTFQLQSSRNRATHGFSRLVWMIYATSTLQIIRMSFRLSYFSALPHSITNPVLSHESLLYIFDATPVFLCLLVNVFIRPGRVLNGPGQGAAVLEQSSGTAQRDSIIPLRDGDGFKLSSEESLPGSSVASSLRYPPAYGEDEPGIRMLDDQLGLGKC